MTISTRGFAQRALPALALWACASLFPAHASGQLHSNLSSGTRPNLGARRDAITPSGPVRRRVNVPIMRIPQAGYFGALAGRIDDYSAFDLDTLLAGRGWFGWETARNCTHCPAGDHTEMLSQAIGDAHHIKLNNLPQFGVVIGRVMNTGEYTDATSLIPGGEIFHDVYYYIIEKQISDTSASIAIARVKHDQGNGMVTEMEVVRPASGIYVCVHHDGDAVDHQAVHRTVAQGDFATCKMPPLPNSLTADRPTAKHRRGLTRFDTTLDAGGWYSCGDGCCTTQAPPYPSFGGRRKTKQSRDSL